MRGPPNQCQGGSPPVPNWGPGSPRGASLLKQPPQHLVGVQMLLGDLAGGPRMERIATVDLLDPIQGLPGRGKRDQPRTPWQVRAEPGLLGENRATRRKVAGTAIAEPPATRLYVAALG